MSICVMLFTLKTRLASRLILICMRSRSPERIPAPVKWYLHVKALTETRFLAHSADLRNHGQRQLSHGLSSRNISACAFVAQVHSDRFWRLPVKTSGDIIK